MAFTVDENTKASSPGQIQISKRKYLDYVGLKGPKRLIYKLLFSLPTNFIYKYFGTNNLVYDYIQKQEQFKIGCLCPTIVINKDKGLIATYTNLTLRGTKVTPVIKISKEPLARIKNITINNGQKLPTVSLYYAKANDEFATAWADFDPKIAHCFTDDLNACNHLLSRITESSWRCLELGIEQVDDKLTEGLYHIKLEKSLVNNTG
ncbi:MAG: DUF3239 domain-containing protein [Bacteroidia bacterium]|nr:DUF3239 domain-containing protein [Bacteroidia bacterium]